MRIFILPFLFCSVFAVTHAQEAVFFYAKDSVKVKGSLYLQDVNLPFIIICQVSSERGGYSEVAPRLLNLNYNCLSIDLRQGASLNAKADIEAAIRYISQINDQPVVLMGSAVSASLCLIVSAGNPGVRAIVALSPGEYFQPRVKVCDAVKNAKQEIFVCATQAEYPYLQKMLAGVPSDKITLFRPSKGKGIQGNGALCRSNPDNGEYWFAIMMFFKKLEGS